MRIIKRLFATWAGLTGLTYTYLFVTGPNYRKGRKARKDVLSENAQAAGWLALFIGIPLAAYEACVQISSKLQIGRKRPVAEALAAAAVVGTATSMRLYKDGYDPRMGEGRGDLLYTAGFIGGMALIPITIYGVVRGKR